MTDQVERELLLPAGAIEVWEVVTGGEWLADEVQLDLRPGGDASFRSGDCLKTGWVEEAQAPRDREDCGRLAFWWAADGEPASRVELTIEPAGWVGSRLHVIETRPLEVLDLVGTQFDGFGGSSHGPALLAA
jgi:hypothetical protein